MVWRHMPPAPGCHLGPVPWPRSPGSSCHVLPPSLVRNNPASSTPAYAVSGSVRDGSRCQTRLNSHGCCVPSYHWCVVSGLPVDRKSTRLNSSHSQISYAVFCLKKKKNTEITVTR